MSRLSPEATFDLLFVVRFATPKSYQITQSEITYFCYLACLLSVYDGIPADEWGYTFAATKTISPYSSALAEAARVLTVGGRFDEVNHGLTATGAAERDFRSYSGQSLFSGRSRYLRAACNSSLVVPLPAVGSALNQEPTLRSALAISASRELLADDSGPRGLHKHFERLAQELPDRSDLFLAAVTWISELASDVSESERLSSMPTIEGGYVEDDTSGNAGRSG